jgi:hypothetical protein
MQRRNPSDRGGQVLAITSPQGDGFVEIAILSLAGLTLSVIMIGQGLFPDALRLLMAQ